MKLVKGKDLVGQPFWQIRLKSGLHLIAYCRYGYHSDINWFNKLLSWL